MKRTIFLLGFVPAFFITLNSFAQSSGYEITGKIEKADGLTFFLQKTTAGKTMNFDTAVVENGIFKMTGGPVEYPEMVYLTASGRMRKLSFFLENSQITISGKLDSLDIAKVSGSGTNDEYSAYQNSLKPLSERIKKIMEELKTAIDKTTAEEKKYQKEFILNNPGSFVSPFLLVNLSKDLNPDETGSLINTLDPKVARTPAILAIKSELAGRATVAVGKKAPDFTLNDVNGKPVSLSSMIGPRLLLVDFWAGWCAPCRQENPNVLKAYNDFHKKGFDIIGVSLDRTKGEWIKAIADDKLPWVQVSDLNYFNSVAAKLYYVKFIPANFLLDEKGVIIAVNLRGEALYTKVKEILSNN